jgi:hypothetical protein
VAGTALSYTVTPAQIEYSAGSGQLSIVSLTITATNNTAADIACASISLTIPMGLGAGALSLDPSTIAPSPGPATPWAVGGGNGTWTAVPLPPVTTVPAGSTVQIVLSDIIVNDAQGECTIAISEITGQTATGSVSVLKATPAPAGTAPKVTSFTATPATVALGGSTTLAWTSENATRWVLGPGGVDVPDPSGSLPVPITETSTFTLDALAPGGRDTATVTVTVAPVAITAFTATPAGPVAAGTTVTLSWATGYAASCSIDQGIGPVAGSGTQVVTPNQSTTYTLSALGLNPATSSVTVTVQS